MLSCVTECFAMLACTRAADMLLLIKTNMQRFIKDLSSCLSNLLDCSYATVCIDSKLFDIASTLNEFISQFNSIRVH